MTLSASSCLLARTRTGITPLYNHVSKQAMASEAERSLCPLHNQSLGMCDAQGSQQALGSLPWDICEVQLRRMAASALICVDHVESMVQHSAAQVRRCAR